MEQEQRTSSVISPENKSNERRPCSEVDESLSDTDGLYTDGCYDHDILSTNPELQ